METIVQEVGTCGKFQIIQVTVVQACRFSAVWALSLMVFGLYNPGWRCLTRNLNSTDLLNDTDYHLNESLYTNLSSAMKGSGMRSSLQTGNGSLPERPHYNATCSSHCDVIEFNPSSFTVVTEFGLVCNDAWKGKLIVTVLNCGMLIGAFFWGQIGERFGRKVSLYIGNFIVSLSCGAAVFSTYFDWEVYAAFTFFIGFGAVGVIPALNVLCMEFLTSEWRARVSSFPVWNTGNICFALACFLLHDWKYVHFASAFVCGLTVLGFFWTPESLPWLAVHGRVSKVKKIVRKMSKVNKKPVSTETLNEFLEMEKSKQNLKNYTYIDLFRSREICFLTIRLCLLWSISIVTYEVIGYGIQSLPGNFYINIILSSSVEFAGFFIVSPLANKFGRRGTGLLFTTVGTLSCGTIITSLLAMEESDLRDTLVTGVAIFVRLIVFCVVSLMVAYGAELIPTPVRNLAFGFFNVATRATGMAASNLIPRDYTSLVICYGALTVGQGLASVIMWTLSETKGKPLRDDLTRSTKGEHFKRQEMTRMREDFNEI